MTTTNATTHDNHYQRGRDYLAAIAQAAVSVFNRENLGTIGEHRTFADRVLWPLDTADADQLRDFIAGINREAETQVQVLASMRGPATEAQQVADTYADEILGILARPDLNTQVRSWLTKVEAMIRMAGRPQDAKQAFCHLGNAEFDIAAILAWGEDHTSVEESGSDPNYTALVETRETLMKFLYATHTDNGFHYRAFIAGQRYAHTRHLG